MRAMVLDEPNSNAVAPLRKAELPVPEPGSGEVRLRVRTCGVCRTDLHVVEGELPPRKRPVMPYPLAQADRALQDLKHGRVDGAAVLTVP